MYILIIMCDRPKTIFCDIDGTIWKHLGDVSLQNSVSNILLPNVKEAIRDWESKCYKIILTTGRKESLRSVTELELTRLGIVYDQLIMGIGGGSRVLINDLRANGDQSAFVYQPKRNEGIGSIDL